MFEHIFDAKKQKTPYMTKEFTEKQKESPRFCFL